MSKYEGYKGLQVVEMGFIHAYPDFTVLEVLQIERLKEDYRYNANGQGYTVSVPYKQPQFLIGIKEETAITLLTKKVEEHFKTICDQSLTISNLQKQVTEGAKCVEVWVAAKDRAEKERIKWENEVAHLRTLEQDIAKIRIAVGDLKMNEILGEKNER